jgi:hypothetical protein
VRSASVSQVSPIPIAASAISVAPVSTRRRALSVADAASVIDWAA